MFSETESTGHEGEQDAPAREQEAPAREQEPRNQSMWDAYWERFRRQEVDDPVQGRREGMWDRFRRQQVDDPVDRPGGRSGS